MVSAWISFSLAFFLGRGGSAGFFSQTLRFVDILLGHSPPSEDTTLSCLVKTRVIRRKRAYCGSAKARLGCGELDLFPALPLSSHASLTHSCECFYHLSACSARNTGSKKGCGRAWALGERPVEASWQKRHFKVNPELLCFHNSSSWTGPWLWL